MPAVPNPTWIFHITPIDNLRSIARTGMVLSKTKIIERGLIAADIAYVDLQKRRGIRKIPISPGGTLHDYVPFYFAPRSPMLFTINEGNVPGCPYRQDDIVHLVSNAQKIHQENIRFVFSDKHAALHYARFFGDLNQLDKINWDIFFEAPTLAGYCKYWRNSHTVAYADRRETRQAEFLVYGSMPLNVIDMVGVHTVECEARVRAALAGAEWNPKIEVIPGWYY